MNTRVVRDIIRIDEEKCDGCGACVLSCAEGAIQIIDGKARLISDNYCDGLGACLGECPRGALSIEKRESEEFDEKAVEEHLASKQKNEPLPCGCPGSSVQQFPKQVELPVLDAMPCGCPSSEIRRFGGEPDSPARTRSESALTHWPVQLTLVPPDAPFLKGADLLLAAHCAPFAYGSFHQDFIRGHSLICACPKLDDYAAHLAKLTDVIKRSGLRSLTVVRMEVPCCGGLMQMARQAMDASGSDIPLREVTVGIRGDLVR